MKNSERLFLDIHAIQTLPPCNINRDDTGSPKTAQYGGVRRARVSSQAWKKAMRDYFYANSEESEVGVRTLEIVQYVAGKIRKLKNSIGEEESLKMADTIFNSANVKTKDRRAKALFFLGNEQAEKLARAAIEEVKDKNILQDILKKNPAVDIALFGRMVADDPFLNEEASAQVAHAISTHAVQTEYDFYTAVDDLAPKDNAGAGMLGTIEFNSSTLYRYANIAVHELLKQLQDKETTVDTLKLFVEAFAKSLPTGKINTFANQTLPQILVVTLRKDRPINLVSAFEKPVRSSDGYTEQSIEKLACEFKRVEKFAEKPLATLYVELSETQAFSELGENKTSLKDLLDDLAQETVELLDR